MEMLSELINSLNIYLQHLTAPMGCLEYIATVICPIIATMAIVVGGCFALYKYISAKNYDINLKILNEVYVPLYEYLVKQETFRYIACPNVSISDAPILEIKSTRIQQKFSEKGYSIEQITETVCGCTRDTLLEINKNTNMGLASTELLSLLSSYEVLIHITSGNVDTTEKAKATLLQQEVELALRKEIIAGYNYYHKKLKLHNSKSQIFKTTNDQIYFSTQFSSDEVQKTLEELKRLPHD